MRAIVKEPGKRPEVRTIEPGYKAIQAVIGDWFERAMHGPGVEVYCDENGLAKKLALNVVRPNDRSPIVGTIVAVAADSDGDRDLTDRQVALWLATLSLIAVDPNDSWRSAALAELVPNIHVGDVAMFLRLRGAVFY